MALGGYNLADSADYVRMTYVRQHNGRSLSGIDRDTQHWADTGCEEHHECLTCPFAACKWDYGATSFRLEQRKAKVIAMLADHGVRGTARKTGITKRTIHRYIKEYKAQHGERPPVRDWRSTYRIKIDRRNREIVRELQGLHGHARVLKAEELRARFGLARVESILQIFRKGARLKQSAG